MALQYKLGQTVWIAQNGSPTQKQEDKIALQYKLGQAYWISKNGSPTQKQEDKIALQYKLGQAVWIAVDESQVITKEAYLDSAYTSSVSNINIEFPLGGYIEICGGVGESTSAGSGGAGEKVIQKFNAGDSIMANISFIAGNKGSDGRTASTESHNSCRYGSSGQYIYTCYPTSTSTVIAKGSPGADGGFKINFKYLLRNKEISIEANGGGGAGGARGSTNYRVCSGDSSLICGNSKTYTLTTDDGNGGSSTNGNSGNGANGGDATTNNDFKWRGSAIVNVWKYKEI